MVLRDAECAKKLKKRTLTNLYNERPTWLDLAHRKLDEVQPSLRDLRRFTVTATPAMNRWAIFKRPGGAVPARCPETKT